LLRCPLYASGLFGVCSWFNGLVFVHIGRDKRESGKGRKELEKGSSPSSPSLSQNTPESRAERTNRSLNAVSEAAKAIKADGAKLVVFPEGNRNFDKNLTLEPFKRGAFHTAINAQMPILPVVVSEYHFLDNNKMFFRSGTATIKVLDMIETDSYTKETMDDLIKMTRDRMLETLKEISTPLPEEKKKD